MLSLPTRLKELMSVLGSVFGKKLIEKGKENKTKTTYSVLHQSLTCNNKETEVLKILQKIMTKESLF